MTPRTASIGQTLPAVKRRQLVNLWGRPFCCFPYYLRQNCRIAPRRGRCFVALFSRYEHTIIAGGPGQTWGTITIDQHGVAGVPTIAYDLHQQ